MVFLKHPRKEHSYAILMSIIIFAIKFDMWTVIIIN